MKRKSQLACIAKSEGIPRSDLIFLFETPSKQSFVLLLKSPLTNSWMTVQLPGTEGAFVYYKAMRKLLDKARAFRSMHHDLEALDSDERRIFGVL